MCLHFFWLYFTNLVCNAYFISLENISSTNLNITIGEFQGELFCNSSWDSDEIYCSRVDLNSVNSVTEGSVLETRSCSVSRRDACDIETIVKRVGFDSQKSPSHILGLVLKSRLKGDDLTGFGGDGALDNIGDTFDRSSAWKFATEDYKNNLQWGRLDKMYSETLPFENPRGLYAPRFLFIYKKSLPVTSKFMHAVHCYDEIQAYSLDTSLRYCCEIFNPDYALEDNLELGQISLTNLVVSKRCVDIPAKALLANTGAIDPVPCNYQDSSLAFCRSRGEYKPLGALIDIFALKYTDLSDKNFGCVYHCRFPCATTNFLNTLSCSVNVGLGTPMWGNSEIELTAQREYNNIDLEIPINSFSCPGYKNAIERHYDQRQTVCTHDISRDPTFIFSCKDRQAYAITKSAQNPGQTCRIGQLGCTRGECRCLNGCDKSALCNGRGTLWHDFSLDSGYCICNKGFVGQTCQFKDLQDEKSGFCHYGQPLNPLYFQTGP